MIATKAIIPLTGNRRVAWLVGVALGCVLLPIPTEEETEEETEEAELDGVTVWLLQLLSLQHITLNEARFKVAFSCSLNFILNDILDASVIAAVENKNHQNIIITGIKPI